MLSFYDKGIIKKLKSWTEKTDVHVYGPDSMTRLIEIMADERKDKAAKFPIVALRREGGFTIKNTAKNATTYRGKEIVSGKDTTVTLRQIPIQINYVLDIYDTRFESVDDLARQFLFNLINNQTVKCVIPFDGIEIENLYTMSLGEDVEDTSDIPGIATKQGQLWRMSIHIQVDDAKLFDIRTTTNVKSLGVKVQIHSSEEDIKEEEIDIKEEEILTNNEKEKN